jgi:hypothetical protein
MRASMQGDFPGFAEIHVKPRTMMIADHSLGSSGAQTPVEPAAVRHEFHHGAVKGTFS